MFGPDNKKICSNHSVKPTDGMINLHAVVEAIWCANNDIAPQAGAQSLRAAARSQMWRLRAASLPPAKVTASEFFPRSKAHSVLPITSYISCALHLVEICSQRLCKPMPIIADS